MYPAADQYHPKSSLKVSIWNTKFRLALRNIDISTDAIIVTSSSTNTENWPAVVRVNRGRIRLSHPYCWRKVGRKRRWQWACLIHWRIPRTLCVDVITTKMVSSFGTDATFIVYSILNLLDHNQRSFLKKWFFQMAMRAPVVCFPACGGVVWKSVLRTPISSISTVYYQYFELLADSTAKKYKIMS